MRLNLGCGTDIKKGYLNIDFEKAKGIDKTHDLNVFPYPFKNNQFEEIEMRNILEHLNDSYNVMLEIHRICAPNAIVKIRVPHFSSNNAWGDLQHKRGFNTDTFKNDNISSKFEIISQEITFPSVRFFIKPLAKLNLSFYEKNFAYLFPALDLVVKLKAKK
jgi:SAM-dependent methyltransferase